MSEAANKNAARFIRILPRCGLRAYLGPIMADAETPSRRKDPARVAARHAKRLERAAYWAEPVSGFRRTMRAYADMVLVDHGIFRYAYLNLHEIAPGVWRSAQPAPSHLARLAKRGFRTIVTARAGQEFGSWALERDACQRHGLNLEQFVVYSRDLPTRHFLLEAAAFFQSLQKPVLFHCKSGADRAGFVSALYLLLHEKRPAREAKQQLHWRYGHFRFSQTGVLDAFFDAYEREAEAHGIGFRRWVRSIYDPERIRREFRPHWLSSLFSDRLLKRE